MALISSSDILFSFLNYPLSVQKGISSSRHDGPDLLGHLFFAIILNRLQIILIYLSPVKKTKKRHAEVKGRLLGGRVCRSYPLTPKMHWCLLSIGDQLFLFLETIMFFIVRPFSYVSSRQVTSNFVFEYSKVSLQHVGLFIQLISKKS